MMKSKIRSLRRCNRVWSLPVLVCLFLFDVTVFSKNSLQTETVEQFCSPAVSSREEEKLARKLVNSNGGLRELKSIVRGNSDYLSKGMEKAEKGKKAKKERKQLNAFKALSESGALESDQQFLLDIISDEKAIGSVRTAAVKEMIRLSKNNPGKYEALLDKVGQSHSTHVTLPYLKGLGKSGNYQNVDRLMSVVDSHSKYRNAAVRELGELAFQGGNDEANKKIAEKLRSVMKSKDELARQYAFKSLGRSGQAGDADVDAALHDVTAVSDEAIRYLKRTKNINLSEALLMRLRRGDVSSTVVDVIGLGGFPGASELEEDVKKVYQSIEDRICKMHLHHYLKRVEVFKDHGVDRSESPKDVVISVNNSRCNIAWNSVEGASGYLVLIGERSDFGSDKVIECPGFDSEVLSGKSFYVAPDVQFVAYSSNCSIDLDMPHGEWFVSVVSVSKNSMGFVVSLPQSIRKVVVNSAGQSVIRRASGIEVTPLSQLIEHPERYVGKLFVVRVRTLGRQWRPDAEELASLHKHNPFFGRVAISRSSVVISDGSGVILTAIGGRGDMEELMLGTIEETSLDKKYIFRRIRDLVREWE